MHLILVYYSPTLMPHFLRVTPLLRHSHGPSGKALICDVVEPLVAGMPAIMAQVDPHDLPVLEAILE